MWFYSIRGTRNRPVKKSEPIYETEQQAIDAGNSYLKNNRASVLRPDDINEVFSITAGREVVVSKK